MNHIQPPGKLSITQRESAFENFLGRSRRTNGGKRKKEKKKKNSRSVRGIYYRYSLQLRSIRSWKISFIVNVVTLFVANSQACICQACAREHVEIRISNRDGRVKRSRLRRAIVFEILRSTSHFEWSIMDCRFIWHFYFIFIFSSTFKGRLVRNDRISEIATRGFVGIIMKIKIFKICINYRSRRIEWDSNNTFED